MKRLHFAVGLFAAVACSGLEAETLLQATVPFEFQVGKVNFPAGDYQFTYSPHMLVVHQRQGDRATAMAMIGPTSRAKAPSTGIVEFRRYGDAYFLARIWTPNSTDGGVLPKSPREKELAKALTPNQTEAIVLQTK